MTRPTGSADLPLHGGRVPSWLSARMARLGRFITEAIVVEYGRDEFTRRIAHPFWFQSFGAVMGMDWHSSGITTAVMAALKRGLRPVADELGIYICGGRGRHSRRTPAELRRLGDRLGLDGEELARSSRLVAKVDSAAVQDGFELYLHNFVATVEGNWCVVQQGMNAEHRQARRYHWLSEGLESFVDQPHSAIEGPHLGRIVNLTDRRAELSRKGQLELVIEGPTRIVSTLRRVRSQPELLESSQPHLQLPEHHEVTASNVVLRRLHGSLAAAADRGPDDYADLLLTPGLGARTVYALAVVAEVIHGAACRFSDPARFSTALGGKDGHPFPVPLDVYDATLTVLRSAVDRARLGADDRLAALKRLDQQARWLESDAMGDGFEAFRANEWARSHEWGGRAVGLPARVRPRARAVRSKAPGQLTLPGTEAS